jgi:hypothetical protein
MFGVGDPSRALEVGMPRNRLTSVMFAAAPMDVAQDHEVFGYREYCFPVVFREEYLVRCYAIGHAPN